MLRRRLSLYTLLYIAGITAGFFMLEKNRVPEAAGFSAAVIAAVLFTGRGAGDTSGICGNQKTVLCMAFLAGLLLFSVRASGYDSTFKCIQDKDHIRGKVISAAVREDKVRLVIRNSEKGPSKVLVTFDHDATERSFADICNMGDADGFRNIGILTGAEIEAGGDFEEIPSADNPGSFDYSIYMKGKGISVQFGAYFAEITNDDPDIKDRMRRYLYKTRESFLKGFSDESEGFIRGIVFGDKSEIEENILEEFSMNSTGHILAVSGLHMGFLYGLLRFFTGRRRTIAVSAAILAVILIYGEMTMWSPATVRACIVMTISLLSTHLRRKADLLTSVSLSAFIILTSEPYQLFCSGFQMSFLALCGIALLKTPISSVLGEALAVMLSVQIGTLPVIAYSYCRVNLLSVLINVPVIMLASLLVPVCILLLMFEMALCKVPETGIGFAELITYAIIKLNHILGFGGEFSIRTAGPGIAVMIALYVFIFGISSEWVRIMLLRKDRKAVIQQGILLLMPLMMLSACFFNSISDDEIVFAAVGQGDCVHLRSGGKDVLIDGGGQPSYGDDKESYNVGKNILMPYLLHSGAENVDIALVTHLHADHYKGIAELAEIYPVGSIGIPIDYKESLNDPEALSISADAETFYVKPDTSIELSDDISIETIWPVEISEEPLTADDPNEHNTVYMIHYKKIKVMVTGDLLAEDEQKMVEFYDGTDTLKCDILKVPHHGSKSSSSEAFLDAVSPRIAVIQCGRNNFYGHPHKETLKKLEERGIRVYRTDINGAVGIDIRSNNILADPFK